MTDQTEQRFILTINHAPEDEEAFHHVECITTDDPDGFKEAVFDELEAALRVKARLEAAFQKVQDFMIDDTRRAEALDAYGKIFSDPRNINYPSLTVQGHHLPGIAGALMDDESGLVQFMKLDDWFKWEEAASLRRATRNFDATPEIPGLDLRDDWRQSRATLSPG